MSSKYTAKANSTTLLSNELDSLGDGSNKITGASLSNDVEMTERNLFADFSLSLAAQASARSAGATVGLYIIPEVDGVFAYGGDALNPSMNHYRGSFRFDASTNARTDILEGVRLPNSDYHVLLINSTGQAFSAAGNILKMEVYPGFEDA